MKILYNIMCLKIKEGSTVCSTTTNISTPEIALLLVLIILIISMILHIRPNSQARAGTRKN